MKSILSTQPLVSAVITTHNRLNYLKQAIESVRQQTYPNIELIVVDDASSDGTKEYCESQDFKYIYIPKEESRGGNHARNLGVLAGTGKYVAFLDDDDKWLPEKTEKQVDLMESNDCELIHCGWTTMTIDGDNVTYSDQIPPPIYWGDLHKKILLRYHYPVTSEIMANRQVLIDIGLYDEGLKASQEYELMIRLAQRKPIYFVNEPLIIYRNDVNDMSRCAYKYQNWINSVKFIYKKHKTLYSTLSLYEKYCEKMRILLEIRGRAKSAKIRGWKLYYACIYIITFPFKVSTYIQRHTLKSYREKFSREFKPHNGK